MITKKFVGLSTFVMLFFTIMFSSFGYLNYYLFDLDFGIFSSFEVLLISLGTFILFSSCLIIYFVLKKYFSYVYWGSFYGISFLISIGVLYFFNVLSIHQFYLILPLIFGIIFVFRVSFQRYFSLENFIVLNSFLVFILSILFSGIYFVGYDNSGFLDDYIVLIEVLNKESDSLVLPYKFDAFAEGFNQGYVKSCQNNEVINCMSYEDFMDNFEKYSKSSSGEKLLDVNSYKQVLESEFSNNMSFKILKIMFSILVSFILIFSAVMTAIFSVVFYYILELLIKLISWILDPLNLEKY